MSKVNMLRLLEKESVRYFKQKRILAYALNGLDQEVRQVEKLPSSDHTIAAFL